MEFAVGDIVEGIVTGIANSALSSNCRAKKLVWCIFQKWRTLM